MTKLRPKADQVYVCWESFGSSDPLGGCARGTRLLGSHEKVKKWPFWFVEDGTADDEIHRMRTKLYQEADAPAPQ
jgi:hypothetical protein